MNTIERAELVLTFKKAICFKCELEGIDIPADSKIAEWIDSGYDLSVSDFMSAYNYKKKEENLFKKFADKVLGFAWADVPSIEEMKEWVRKNGYDVDKFLKERTIKSYSKPERVTLEKSLEMGDVSLVALWNRFIEEARLYGEDSYIYDLESASDVTFLAQEMSVKEFEEAEKIAKENKTSFIQWFSCNDGKIEAKTDIKAIIIAYWGEIYTAILENPGCYDDGITCDNYFVSVFFPALRSVSKV